MRVLVDTCVIIDALQNRAPFCEEAQQIFVLIANKQVAGYISAKSVTDIYYLTHRAMHSDCETRRILNTLFALFDILDTTSLDCRKALSSEITDYEDAVMCETAYRSDIDCIVTRNQRDYTKAEVKVYTPKEFLQHMEFCE
ncbi:MAG: PIN domain-containing protein [Lachnospiraceae bacterium]